MYVLVRFTNSANVMMHNYVAIYYTCKITMIAIKYGLIQCYWSYKVALQDTYNFSIHYSTYFILMDLMGFFCDSETQLQVVYNLNNQM